MKKYVYFGNLRFEFLDYDENGKVKVRSEKGYIYHLQPFYITGSIDFSKLFIEVEKEIDGNKSGIIMPYKTIVRSGEK